MDQRTIEHNGKEYTINVWEKTESLTITSPTGYTLPINALPDGRFGFTFDGNIKYSSETLENAVEWALTHLEEIQEPPPPTEAFRAMIEYMENGSR